MLRIVIAVLSFFGSVAQAQTPPSSATECAQWRQTLSKGQKLPKNDQGRFALCVDPIPKSGIAPSYSIGIPSRPRDGIETQL